MSTGQLTRRYAKALFELAKESNQLPALSTQVKLLAQIVNREIIHFFANPYVSLDAKYNVIDELTQKMNASQILSSFLKLLVKNHRTEILLDTLAQISKLADEAAGIVRLHVTSAKALNAAQIQFFEKTFASALKKTVVVQHKVDEALYAGFVVNLGNTQLDASLKTKLAKIKSFLLNGV